ncbi:MAG: stage V sporulation protein AA [Clostridiales bacterium]|nr:stage V sporulation protein AA [Clostridiales bacterium]
MDIYIKPAKRAQLIGRKIIYLKDVAEIFGGGQLNLGQTIVGEFQESDKSMQLISALDIVQALVHKYPNETLTVNNVGEKETVVTFVAKEKTEPIFLRWLKVCAISVVLFMGGATAIMSFHSDADISGIMKAYYKVVFDEESENPLILEIPYSLGLGIGILVFFNHFSLWRLSDDPTPIEVQMTTYEDEVKVCLADNLEKKRKSGRKKGKDEKPA